MLGVDYFLSLHKRSGLRLLSLCNLAKGVPEVHLDLVHLNALHLELGLRGIDTRSASFCVIAFICCLCCHHRKLFPWH